MVGSGAYRRGGLDRRRVRLRRLAVSVAGRPLQARTSDGRGGGSVGNVGAVADRPGGAVLQRRRLLPARRPDRRRRPRRSVLPDAGHQRPHQEHGAARPRRRPHLRRLLRLQRPRRKDLAELRRQPVGQPDLRPGAESGARREGRGRLAAVQRGPARHDDRHHHGRRETKGRGRQGRWSKSSS